MSAFGAMTRTADMLVDQAAYDRLAYFALRPQLFHEQAADVKPTRQSMPGSTVLFEQVADSLGTQTAALNESTDVTPVTVTDAQVTVTLVEQGAALRTSAKLRGTSYIEVDPVAANLVGWSAGKSMDILCRTALIGATNVIYPSAARQACNQVLPTDTLTGTRLREAVSRLRSGNSVPVDGTNYLAIIHPDSEFDLMNETGAGSWSAPVEYVDTIRRYTGEVGTYGGARVLVTANAGVVADAGSSTTLTDVYTSVVFGQQAVAKAYSTTDGNGEMAKIVPGPITDVLKRFVPLGWYWLGGYSKFRDASIWRIDNASSIGTNA